VRNARPGQRQPQAPKTRQNPFTKAQIAPPAHTANDNADA